MSRGRFTATCRGIAPHRLLTGGRGAAILSAPLPESALMRNEQTLETICRQLQANCGDILAATKAAGVSQIFLQQWRKDDNDVNDRVLEAERLGSQGLVSAAIKRAVYGVEKGIYYRGERVATETEYSDGLLQTLLKAKVSEFAKEDEANRPQVTVNIANLMPRAETYEQWLEMKRQTLAPRLEAAIVQDVEFADVISPFKGIEL